MIATVLARMFGLEHPIVLGPMGSVSGGRLAAAVCNAGGLGPVVPIDGGPCAQRTGRDKGDVAGQDDRHHRLLFRTTRGILKSDTETQDALTPQGPLKKPGNLFRSMRQVLVPGRIPAAP